MLLTSAGWVAQDSAVEASGFVAVVESGATCTLTLTAGGTSRTAAGPAEPSASTTECPVLSLSRDQLTPGPWSAVLSYTSASTSAASAPTTIEVP
jgi:hypothetical protein